MVKFLKSKYFFVVFILFIFFLSLRIITYFQIVGKRENVTSVIRQQWSIRSIDTMKFSRDLAREKLNDKSFDGVIDRQMADIAATGANYVALGTPYDDEFRSMLVRWVNAARKHKLKVWFRGNFSGWEEWFDYSKIDEPTHIIKTQQFVLGNKDLFADGDIFTSCPECENGAKIEWGDPQGLQKHRAFLIVEYGVAKKAFAQIGKKVETGYYSMNGDLAAAIMDRPTTSALGGVVVVDHYVDSPERLERDIRNLAEISGGKIVLGEFGAPIPDIHGKMTEKEQGMWVRGALTKISQIPELMGVNYWVNRGGSTALWNSDGSARKAVGSISDFFRKGKL